METRKYLSILFVFLSVNYTIIGQAAGPDGLRPAPQSQEDAAPAGDEVAAACAIGTAVLNCGLGGIKLLANIFFRDPLSVCFKEYLDAVAHLTSGAALSGSGDFIRGTAVLLNIVQAAIIYSEDPSETTWIQKTDFGIHVINAAMIASKLPNWNARQAAGTESQAARIKQD